jgi:hypothetical protein
MGRRVHTGSHRLSVSRLRISFSIQSRVLIVFVYFVCFMVKHSAQPTFLPPIVAKCELLAENVFVLNLGSQTLACETEGDSER